VRLGYGYQWAVLQRDKKAEANPDRGFTALGRGALGDKSNSRSFS